MKKAHNRMNAACCGQHIQDSRKPTYLDCFLGRNASDDGSNRVQLTGAKAAHLSHVVVRQGRSTCIVIGTSTRSSGLVG
jgi:hypothetical protein